MRFRQAACLALNTLLAAAIAACASTQAGVKTSNCQIAARDSVFLAGGPAYRDCAVSVAAKRVSVGTHPDVHLPDHRDGCYSVDIEFVVDATGRPETNTARIVRTNSRDVAEAVLAVLGTWRYDPAMLDGQPVRQIVTDHEMFQTYTAIVPKGSPPPSGPPPDMPQATC